MSLEYDKNMMLEQAQSMGRLREGRPFRLINVRETEKLKTRLIRRPAIDHHKCMNNEEPIFIFRGNEILVEEETHRVVRQKPVTLWTRRRMSQPLSIPLPSVPTRQRPKALSGSLSASFWLPLLSPYFSLYSKRWPYSIGD